MGARRLMMLGRTAANLFWLSRYVERAENVARLIDTGYRMALTAPRGEASSGGENDHLVSMMKAASVDEIFAEKYDSAEPSNVIAFMLFDEDNPSSIYTCLKRARTNARSERTSLTSDMWESINSTWLEFADVRPYQITGKKLPDLMTWVKKRNHEFRGALLGTNLRTDAFSFSQLGSFTERGDNTARILDMKYYVLLPRATLIGGEVDIQQWGLILRAASAHRSYRHIYHDRLKAWNIADFLILRPEMPRSLIFCARWIRDTLDSIAGFYGEQTEAHEAAQEMADMLEGKSMDSIFGQGLHEFLNEFINRNNSVTQALSKSYNFY